MNLKFKSTKQILPKHGECILFLKEIHSIYDYSIEPTFTSVEWCWEDGNGSSLSHDPEYTTENRPKDYQYLTLMDDRGFTMWTDFFPKHWREEDRIPNHFWWMPEDDYYKQIREAKYE